MSQNNPSRRDHLHSQVFHGRFPQSRPTIPMFPDVLALRCSIRSSSDSTLRTYFDSLSFETYSSTSSHNHIYTVLPELFTLAHLMSMRFICANKGLLAGAGIINEEAENAAVFCAIDALPENYLPTAGDGKDGGGIELLDTAWGDRALSLANEVLSEFGDDFKLFALVTTPNGCVLIRIESVSDKYGCPSVEMLHSYSVKYRKRLIEESFSGMLPYDLGFEVGCPGRRRVLKVPDELTRFKDLPMSVNFVGSDGKEYDCVLFLWSVEKPDENVEKSDEKSNENVEKSDENVEKSDEKEGYCVWCISDFDPEKKDRAITRQSEWRVEVPFTAHKSVTCFVQFIP